MAEDDIGDSILNSTKKALGLAPDYTDFDFELIMHINSVFARLQQLDVGPEIAFTIKDKDDEWVTFIGNTYNIESVRTYMYLMVKLIFDVPQNSFTIEAFKQRAEYFEFQLQVERDGKPKT